MWENIDREFAGHLSNFEEYLKSRLNNKGSFLNQIANTVLNSGGKRLRPAFVILFATLDSFEKLNDEEFRNRLFNAAAAIEILHTATLVHDDIIDDADTRRGRITVSKEYGTKIAVYSGDYLLVKAMSLLAESGLETDNLKALAKGMAAICMGEVDQFFQKFQMTSELSYLKRITKKTAILFSISAAIGAKIGNLPDKDIKNAAKFGLYYGSAFQIRDDILDLKSNEKTEGKPVLKDLAHGIVTLPLIIAAKNNPKINDAINGFFETKDVSLSKEIINEVLKTDSIGKSQDVLNKYLRKSKDILSKLPAGHSSDILLTLCESMYV